MKEIKIRDNGAVTPEAQAEYLARHGHLELIKHMGATQERYFTFDGQGFKVIHVAGKVAQINKMSEDEVKRIVSCAKLQFGGF